MFSNTEFYLDVLYLFLIAVVVKLVPSLLLIFSKISLSKIFAGGFLLSARFSLIIAMAEIGVELDLLSKNLEQQIILLAVLTATVSPLMFRVFNKHSEAN